MKHWSWIIITLLITVALCTLAVAQGNLTDPYEILNRHFEASGGLDRLKAENSAYVEGTLAVAGLKGTLKAWTQKPDLRRTEVDLGILKITQGDNGKSTWALDSNGKLQKITKEDEATIKRREVKRRMTDYEYADPKSGVFSVTFDGTDKVNDKDCYAVKITNNINEDSQTLFINSATFLLEKSATLQGEESTDSYPGDYRKVEGLMVPFYNKEVARLTGQEQEVTVTTYVSNPTIEPALFEPPEEGGKDFEFVEGDRSENIPFQFIGNHLFLPVVVGCKERLWVLDTGAEMSAISRKFAQELGLRMEGDMKGAGAGGTVAVSFTTLPSYSIKGIDFKEQKVAVIDMVELNRMLGIEVAGILGFDFLSRFVARVDYANELVSFYDPETFEYVGEGTKLDVHIKGQVFEVSATLDGRHSGTWLFDLGASNVSLEAAFAVREGYANRKGVVGLGRGAGQTFESKSVKCDSIQIAGFSVYQPKVGLISVGADTALVADRIGGLGNSLFRNFVVYCDYAHELVVLEKGAMFNQPWPEDHSGLQLMWDTAWTVIEVLFVSPGTPAEKAGFKIGDVLRSINGIDVKYVDGVIAVRKMLTENVGTRYDFVVGRGGQENKLKLTLAELY